MKRPMTELKLHESFEMNMVTVQKVLIEWISSDELPTMEELELLSEFMDRAFQRIM